jgi:hypothetical protein
MYTLPGGDAASCQTKARVEEFGRLATPVWEQRRKLTELPWEGGRERKKERELLIPRSMHAGLGGSHR